MKLWLPDDGQLADCFALLLQAPGGRREPNRMSKLNPTAVEEESLLPDREEFCHGGHRELRIGLGRHFFELFIIWDSENMIILCALESISLGL